MTVDPSIAEQEPQATERVGGMQYGRVIRVQVLEQTGAVGREWDERFQIKVSVSRNDKGKADPAKVDISNLNEDTRRWLEQDGLEIRILAGYVDEPGPPLLFQGQVDEAVSKKDGQDWTTKIEARDGGNLFDESSVVISYAGTTDSSTILRRIAQDHLKLPLRTVGSLPSIQYTNGYTVMDSGPRALDKITDAAGIDWSIQNGELVLTAEGEPLDGEIPLITGRSLLSFERVKHKKKKTRKASSNGVKFAVLCNARLKPKGKLYIRSAQATGLFQVKSVKFDLDTRGGDWKAEVEATELKG